LSIGGEGASVPIQAPGLSTRATGATHPLSRARAQLRLRCSAGNVEGMRRRTFLQLGLCGGALLFVGDSALSLYRARRAMRPRRPLQVIHERRFGVLAAAAARVVTVPGADPVEIAHRVDEALARTTPEAGVEFNQLLGLLESALVGMLLDRRRPRAFTELAPSEQDAALSAFRDSRFVLRRSGYNALRKLCTGAYYGLESSWAVVGYPGPPQIPLDVPLDAPAPVAAAPAPAPAAAPAAPAPAAKADR
jgi:hypothetical protein